MYLFATEMTLYINLTKDLTTHSLLDQSVDFVGLF